MFSSVAFPVLFAAISNAANATHRHCRTRPGDPSFPTAQQLSQLNSSIEGRLIHVVPSGQFCNELSGGCPDAEWTDSVFRSDIPGAMLQSTGNIPPSLCFRNISCDQGSVPVYAVNATSASHIQAGVRFAQKHNLKVAIKASGHDYLGRSTAKNSLLLWTRYFENITFHDSFKVGGKDEGSAVTVGGGVGLHEIYQATKQQGKIFVGGTAANVVAAGGYIQGAGHSALGPLYGLASDNVLVYSTTLPWPSLSNLYYHTEFQVVVANGDIVTANEVSHPDRGAGSWGVIISATLRTFPTFDLVQHVAIINLNSSSAAGQPELATFHAQHIFDWDELHASQYFFLAATPPTFAWLSIIYFPNPSITAANASLTPILNAVTAQGFTILNNSASLNNANDALSPNSSDNGAMDLILGSRLVSADVYRHDVTAIGQAYTALFNAGVQVILGHLVAGGRVSQNAHISSAVNPKWRTAKTHYTGRLGDKLDDTPPDTVESIRRNLTENQVPILDALAGPGSGSYSNEADVREPAFQTTFFGLNYDRLSAIKDIYDPTALFIVGGGVGSQRWDADGLCRIA